MGGSWLLVPTAVFVVFGSALLARLWTSWTSRLTAFAVTCFGSVVIAFQSVGVLAAVSGRPVVTPLSVAIASGALALVLLHISSVLSRRGFASRGAVEEAEREPGSRTFPDVWRVAVMSVAAIAVLPHAVVLGLSAPPRGWDVLSYHMPKALSWLQHGNLGNYGSVAAFYPGNGETAILLSLFTGSDRMAPLVQLPFALLGAVALYGIARRLGAGKRPAFVPTFLFLGCPMVLFQSAIAKDDLMVTALVLAGAFMLLNSLDAHAQRRTAALNLAVSGFAIGLAVGVKYSVLALAVLSVPVVLAIQMRAGRVLWSLAAPEAFRSAVSRTLLFSAAMLVPSLFWFVQNWIVAGGPLAPLSVDTIARAFHRHDLSYVSGSAAWWWFPWIDRATSGSYSASAGFGAAFAALGPPALGLSAWALLRGDGRPVLRLRTQALLALVAVGALAWWFGGHHLPRFLLPVVALACAPAALLFGRVRRQARIGLTCVLVAAVLFSFTESLRVVYASDDLVSSRKPFVSKAEYYNMPPLVYELPPGTKILLLSVPGFDVFRTFKYPVAGDLPGNEVVMMGDFGLESDLVADGAVRGHAALLRDGVEYIFLRTLALPPGATVFDSYPDLYAKVLDMVQEPYPWYKEGFLPTQGEAMDVRAPAVTKAYKVLGQ